MILCIEISFIWVNNIKCLELCLALRTMPRHSTNVYCFCSVVMESFFQVHNKCSLNQLINYYGWKDRNRAKSNMRDRSPWWYVLLSPYGLWLDVIMGKGTGKNVRQILCCNELSGLNEVSPVVSPHQASLCCGPRWDLMKESEVKNIKWQNCWTFRWKIRHTIIGPFHASTTKQTTSHLSHWNCRGREIPKVFY